MTILNERGCPVQDRATDPAAGVTTLCAADWLSLSAAPTFAVMALLTGVFGGGNPDFLCANLIDASPLGGMGAMYMLMSAFHLAPWLKLMSMRRGGGAAH